MHEPLVVRKRLVLQIKYCFLVSFARQFGALCTFTEWVNQSVNDLPLCCCLCFSPLHEHNSQLVPVVQQSRQIIVIDWWLIVHYWTELLLPFLFASIILLLPLLFIKSTFVHNFAIDNFPSHNWCEVFVHR